MSSGGKKKKKRNPWDPPDITDVTDSPLTPPGIEPQDIKIPTMQDIFNEGSGANAAAGTVPTKEEWQPVVEAGNWQTQVDAVTPAIEAAINMKKRFPGKAVTMMGGDPTAGGTLLTRSK